MPFTNVNQRNQIVLYRLEYKGVEYQSDFVQIVINSLFQDSDPVYGGVSLSDPWQKFLIILTVIRHSLPEMVSANHLFTCLSNNR